MNSTWSIDMALPAQDPQQLPQEAPPQEASAPNSSFASASTPELVSGIHDAMLQLMQNVDQSGQANPEQMQALAGAVQSYRSAIASLSGEQPQQQEVGGNTTLEQGNAETIPA